jgi:hypothetical protein
MPSSINSKARRRQRRIASALLRDDSAATQVQVPLAPDARAFVDDAVFGDSVGSRLAVTAAVAVAVFRVRRMAVVAAGTAASLPGPIGAADV